jgi:hypothetical protein
MAEGWKNVRIQVQRLLRCDTQLLYVTTVHKTVGLVLHLPSIGQLLKSLGFGSLFGDIAGVATTVFLSVLLISVSTSPFVPKAWRPQTQAPDKEELDRESKAGRQRDRASTNFKHPLLMLIALYSTGSLIAPWISVGVF